MKVEHTVNIYIHSSPAQLNCIEKTLEKLFCTINQNQEVCMSVISDFIADQKSFNIRQAKAIDGLVEDIKSLNDKINALPDGVTEEEKLALAELKTESAALSDRLESLDNLTPPNPPVVA